MTKLAPKSKKSSHMLLSWSWYIPNVYEWLHIIETDMAVWFLSNFRVLGGLNGRKFVKKWSNIAKWGPKSKKSSLRPLRWSWYIRNTYEWLYIIEIDTPALFLSYFRVFGGLQSRNNGRNMVKNLSKLPNESLNLTNQAIGYFLGHDTSPMYMNGCI